MGRAPPGHQSASRQGGGWAPSLGRLLKDGGVFLLDGLDEVPEAECRREVVLGAIRALAATLPDAARLLVTARPYAYADKKWHLAGFPILALAPFSPEQVERFIERWYRAARQPMGWSEETAGTKGGQLRDALRDRPYLGDLASRPLLLTLMATLHSSWGQLPDDRAQLFEEVVKLPLGRWQRAREVGGPTGEPVIEPGISQALSVGDERIREALERLALEVHERQRGQRQREGPADISEGEVLVAFKPLLGEVNPEVLLARLPPGPRRSPGGAAGGRLRLPPPLVPGVPRGLPARERARCRGAPA